MGGGGINLFKFTCTMTFLSNVILILLGVQLNIHNQRKTVINFLSPKLSQTHQTLAPLPSCHPLPLPFPLPTAVSSPFPLLLGSCGPQIGTGGGPIWVAWPLPTHRRASTTISLLFLHPPFYFFLFLPPHLWGVHRPLRVLFRPLWLLPLPMWSLPDLMVICAFLKTVGSWCGWFHPFGK